MGTIYKITNTVNGKAYIGQTVQKPERRIKMHLNGWAKRSLLIHRAVAKYGKDAFEVEILHEGVFDFMLDDLERESIKEHNTFAPNGYNLEGGGNTNKHVSNSTRQKQSKVALGRKQPPQAIRKTAEFHRGRKRSPETCQKISAAAIGNKYALGHRHTPETRQKQSEVALGRKQSPEHRHNNSQARLRYYNSERPDAWDVLESLPVGMSLKQMRKKLYALFPHISQRKIHDWVQKWHKSQC